MKPDHRIQDAETRLFARSGRQPDESFLDLDGFRQPRADSVLTDGELRRITAPTMFCLGTDDPFLTPVQARPAVPAIPGAVLHEVPGGHGPWLEDPAGCAKLVIGHFTATGFPPAGKC